MNKGKTKTSVKIGGSVAIIILLLGITVLFGIFQMSKVSNEVIEISEAYTPLYSVISEIKNEKLNQNINLEKILRYSESKNLVELEKAKEEFWQNGGIIDSRIQRAKDIVNIGKDVLISENSHSEFDSVYQKLNIIDELHNQHEEMAREFILKLDSSDKEAILEQLNRVDDSIQVKLEEIMVYLSQLTEESMLQIESNESDSLFGQILIIGAVGGLAISLGFFISQIKNDLKKEIDLKTSELKIANKKLRELDKMKDEFIGIASHELKSPIQPILGFAELAKAGDIDQKEAWDGVLGLATKLQDLANAVLDVSKIEGNKLELNIEKIRINDLILDIIKSFKLNLKKPIIIKENLDENILVDLDKVRISQVLQNLLNNSLKFTSSGSITIETHVYENENKIQIKIIDTGLGIPKEVLPKLFEKFVTKGIHNKVEAGTGLGLFLCRGIVAAHGGKIHASNNFDSGATFEFTLPIVSKDKIRKYPELSVK